MEAYSELAGCYDAFTTDVNYAAWASFISSELPDGTSSVLDLACGTGTLTLMLAEAGYDMIGVDRSAEMLSVAATKAESAPCAKPLFLMQDMTELDLYGTVDAAVCCLDSLNYLSSVTRLDKVMARLKNFVRPGGMFLFDVNTEKKFMNIDGESFIRENDDTFCVWSSDYDVEKRLCRMTIEVFEKRGALWARRTEEHIQRAHSEKEICDSLRNNSFETVKKCSPPIDDEHRVFYITRRV